MHGVQFIVFICIFLILRVLKIYSPHWTSLIWTSIIFMFIFIQPSLIQLVFSLVSCRKISDGDYINAEVSLECYDA